MSTYSLRTPFYDLHYSPGKVIIAFILYADSLLSINLITVFLYRAYKLFTTRFVTWKLPSSVAFPSCGSASRT